MALLKELNIPAEKLIHMFKIPEICKILFQDLPFHMKHESGKNWINSRIDNSMEFLKLGQSFYEDIKKNEPSLLVKKNEPEYQKMSEEDAMKKLLKFSVNKSVKLILPTINDGDDVDNAVLPVLLPIVLQAAGNPHAQGNWFYSQNSTEASQAVSFKVYSAKNINGGISVSLRYYSVDIKRTGGNFLFAHWGSDNANVLVAMMDYFMPQTVIDKLNGNDNIRSAVEERKKEIKAQVDHVEA